MGLTVIILTVIWGTIGLSEALGLERATFGYFWLLLFTFGYYWPLWILSDILEYFWVFFYFLVLLGTFGTFWHFFVVEIFNCLMTRGWLGETWLEWLKLAGNG